jgi:hypothetical protein
MEGLLKGVTEHMGGLRRVLQKPWKVFVWYYKNTWRVFKVCYNHVEGLQRMLQNTRRFFGGQCKTHGESSKYIAEQNTRIYF